MKHLPDINKNKRLVCHYLFDYPAQCNEKISVEINRLKFDFNIPCKESREVLDAIKTAPELKNIPVVILTSSEAQQDITNAYNMQANCYITKPVDLKQYLNVIN